MVAIDPEIAEDGTPPVLLEAIKSVEAENVFEECEELKACTLPKTDLMGLVVERSFAAASQRFIDTGSVAEMSTYWTDAVDVGDDSPISLQLVEYAKKNRNS